MLKFTALPSGSVVKIAPEGAFPADELPVPSASAAATATATSAPTIVRFDPRRIRFIGFSCLPRRRGVGVGEPQRRPLSRGRRYCRTSAQTTGRRFRSARRSHSTAGLPRVVDEDARRLHDGDLKLCRLLRGEDRRLAGALVARGLRGDVARGG